MGSTFEDLKSHRTRTIDALKGLAVHVEAMELWFAKPGDPLTVCLERVRDSDVYVCVVAHRYGSVTESGASITQSEYQTARKAGLDCLVFLMSKQYQVPSNFVDKGKAGEKLEEFKEVLRKNHLCASFTSPEDLAHKVVESVRDLMEAKGIRGAATLNLDEFWKDMQLMWETLEPADLRMEFNPKAQILDLIEALEDQVKGVQGFHRHIESSYARLESDLRTILKKIGYDPARLEKIPYHENPFAKRDWEWITFFPNRLKSCQIALAQLRVKCLELLIQTSESTEELTEILGKAKRELEDAVRSGITID